MKLKGLIAEYACKEEKDIRNEHDLCNDLRLDSLDLAQLVMIIEEEYAIRIEDEDAEQWRTVQDIVDYMEKTYIKGGL